MTCSSLDLKALALEEAPASTVETAHIEACERCREEVERLRLTRTALLRLKEEEVPQRIAFVSDQIFEPRWWRRMWGSGPAMGFASAMLLAAAIVAHGYAPGVRTAPPERVETAQVERQIQAEVGKRVDAELARIVKTSAESEARAAKATQLLDAAEKRFELQRQSDIAMMQQTAHYYENKMGQLMVASNRNLGGGQ